MYRYTLLPFHDDIMTWKCFPHHYLTQSGVSLYRWGLSVGRPPASLSGDDGSNHSGCPPLIFRRINYLGAVVFRNGLVFSNNRQASWWIHTPIARGWIFTAFSCYMTNMHSLAWCFSVCDVVQNTNCCRSGLVVIEGVGSLNLTTTAPCWVSKGADSCIFYSYKWPLLLTWFNFNPRMDKYLHAW